jgi:4-oxalocrotonate tautomerase
VKVTAIRRTEEAMPHVIVKLYSGRSKQQKNALAEALTRAIVETLRSGEESISIGIEEFEPKDWTAQVYKPDIIGKAGTLYKKPGYEPL